MERHVEQPPLAGGEQLPRSGTGHLRHAGDRRGIQPATPHDAQPAGPFGDQDVAIGQPGHAPGVLQPPYHRFDRNGIDGQGGGIGTEGGRAGWGALRLWPGWVDSLGRRLEGRG